MTMMMIINSSHHLLLVVHQVPGAMLACHAWRAQMIAMTVVVLGNRWLNQMLATTWRLQ